MSDKIQPEELFAMLQQGKKLCLLDVREKEEVLISSLPGSIHIPLMSLAENLDRLKELSVSSDYQGWVVICRSGQRSEMARKWLVEQGVENFSNLSDGINGYAKRCDSSLQVY